MKNGTAGRHACALWMCLLLAGCVPAYFDAAGGKAAPEDLKVCRQEGYEALGWIRGNPVAFLQVDREKAAIDACMHRKGYATRADPPR